VTVITRAQLESEGIQTAFEAMERLSANSSIGGLNSQGAIGATGTGFSSASLRGLGGTRTLVLMNGRRLANTSFNGGMVDINSIPISAIERIEVLTDGASAIYGTDAIAGVINFILRKDFTGVEAYAYYGDSEQGGGKTERYSGTLGWGELARDKFNVFATFDYTKIEEIHAAQRELLAQRVPSQRGRRRLRPDLRQQRPRQRVPAGGPRAPGHDAQPRLSQLPAAVLVPDGERGHGRAMPVSTSRA
jgi:iron complex outermembrane receptor protein